MTTLVFEPTLASDYPDKVCATVAAHGGRVSWVELTCSDEEIQRRITSSSRAQFGKLQSYETLNRLRQRGGWIAPPGLRSDLVLDISALSAADGAAAITKGLTRVR